MKMLGPEVYCLLIDYVHESCSLETVCSVSAGEFLSLQELLIKNDVPALRLEVLIDCSSLGHSI